MSVREHPNIFANHPKDEVAEWLANPVTRWLREVFRARQDHLKNEAADLCAKIAHGSTQFPGEAARIGSDLNSIAMLDVEVFGKAEEYVKQQ